MIKTKGFLSTICLVLFFLLEVYSQTPPTDSLFVWAESGLNMRDQPKLDGKRLANIPFGTGVKIEAYEGTYFYVNDEMGNLGGRWAYVDYKGQKGYVFDGYLFKEPTPNPREGDMEYFKRAYGPILHEVEEKQREERHIIKTTLLQNGVTISINERSEKSSIPSIFLPFIDPRQALLLAKNLYATPTYFSDREFNLIHDKEMKMIRIEEKEGGVGCYFRIQLLSGATGGDFGAVITSYCGC